MIDEDVAGSELRALGTAGGTAGELQVQHLIKTNVGAHRLGRGFIQRLCKPYHNGVADALLLRLGGILRRGHIHQAGNKNRT